MTACQTIAYAHSRGVIHRDVKPANVMLGEYGEALVVDWGLAKPLGPSGDEPGGDAGDAPGAGAAGVVEPTAAGIVKGSPAYMSPEQAAGRWDEVGPASDVYALGATLYALLTGVRPFDGASVAEVLSRVRGPVPAPAQGQGRRPAALEAICLKAMSLRPGDRYPGALDLAADVDRWLSGEPVRAWREPWPDRLRRWVRRHRMLVAAAVAALAVGAAVLVVTNGRLRILAHRLDESNTRLRTALQRRREEPLRPRRRPRRPRLVGRPTRPDGPVPRRVSRRLARLGVALPGAEEPAGPVLGAAARAAAGAGVRGRRGAGRGGRHADGRGPRNPERARDRPGRPRPRHGPARGAQP